jgi:glucose-6-phosphate 1-epimerase
MMEPDATARLPSGETLVVSRYGGQVLSWRDRAGKELLYLSPLSRRDGGSAIRGGVPVCFPQFASRGPLVKHGFARTSLWTEVPGAGAGAIRMVLTGSEETLAEWPHRFRLELLARLDGESLVLELSVRNTDTKPWTFTGALHTYLRTEEVAGGRLEGLSDHAFEDALANGSIRHDTGPDLSQPLDRIYLQASQPVVLREGEQALRIAQQGFTDVVVWNPGAAGGAKVPDMPPGDHARMLCVEAAQISKPVLLGAGEVWVGTQTLAQIRS